ncbi:4-oxalomesaconate tautomerase [Cereibacter sphaeroides]|uniref:4-oxalomesaconate tautomerase n=1 Tax=Cereibacter sphaeroides TaxID=1063 RepID=UPI001F3C7936|nr:4-oxalomesaconate tautomerase [Cereibacter sphaeroides]MCE6957647.1 4-oxalomesaconate tautomerase [Cereibacter sphaeroides]MCE6971146.1 4-oxalomesaconate tautomerase [Cereibacter sphaeroides]
MDDLVRIPCVLMRGGTSRGPFFLASDLPIDPKQRDAVLIEIMGSGHPLEIDGIGGGNSLSSKVAIIGPPTREGADVDYLFAQVKVEERAVDLSPNCGNMLSAVGPFAIEAGLVPIRGDRTTVRVHNVNTGKIIEAVIETPGGTIRYQGEAVIDGVPGMAAPVYLAFTEAVGAKTGLLLPTGTPQETIEGIPVSLIDGATPVMIVRAEAFGLSGSEPALILDANRDFMAKLEAMRIEAGARMGLGDVRSSVLPKPILIGQPLHGGTLSVRYFTPHACHTSLATTGAVTVAMAATLPDSLVGASMSDFRLPADLMLEHPTGRMGVRVALPAGASFPAVYVMRTCRRLFEGAVLARRKN